MKDVLATLQKLPPKCAAVIEGQAVFIRRGALDTAPAHIPTDQVGVWNQGHGITRQQAQAMVVGATLGWDKDGADPDTHAADLGSEPGPFLFTFAATIVVELKVSAFTEEQATEAGNSLARDVIETVDGLDPEITGASFDSLDLIESTAP